LKAAGEPFYCVNAIEKAADGSHDAPVDPEKLRSLDRELPWMLGGFSVRAAAMTGKYGTPAGVEQAGEFAVPVSHCNGVGSVVDKRRRKVHRDGRRAGLVGARGRGSAVLAVREGGHDHRRRQT